jgi:hypothetical protein
MKKLFAIFLSVLFLSNGLSASAELSEDDINGASDPHFPIISAPFGFVRGAALGTRAVAGALGDEDGVLEGLVGFIIGAPIGAVSGTVAGLFGGPFSNKKSDKE